MIKVLSLALVVALGVSACTRAGEQPAKARDAAAQVDSEIQASLGGPARLDKEKARDVFRHPRETLELFGLRDDMHVVELWAPDGYYTSILAPVLRDHGKLTAAFVDPAGDYSGQPQPKKFMTEASKRFIARLDKNPEVYDRVDRVVMKPPVFSFGGDSTADLVVTFRNVHNWILEGYEDAVFAAAYRALKPGGVLGIVEHRGLPGMTRKQIEDDGYVPEDVVVALATKAGFHLVAHSEINANPKDTKDHPDGVWTLPPFYSLKDKDHAKYEAIGESDRMTLKFTK